MRRRLIFGYRTHTYCVRGCVRVGEVRVTAHRVEVDLAPDSGGGHKLVRRATAERNVEFFSNDGREVVELRKRLRWLLFHQRLGLRWLRDLQLRLRLSRATDVLSAANQQHKGRNYEPDSGPSAACRHVGRSVTAIQFQYPHHFAEGKQSVSNGSEARRPAGPRHLRPSPNAWWSRLESVSPSAFSPSKPAIHPASSCDRSSRRRPYRLRRRRPQHVET